MNRLKFHVKKGDNVEVISGNHPRFLRQGPRGACPQKQRVLIEGVRMIKKHLRKSQDNPQGDIAEREGPIHISNVKVRRARRSAGKARARRRRRQANERKGAKESA